ncbi:adenosine deaminase [Rathayibacter sp. VKM Ac-2759]|uniref:adenosine deaminase family protein n=1 Tax=Rathayibacter sp. VKM Ac-2759 TaxID=2609252 RepID=UPI0013196AEC|nr:adenosine deaminase family protein [Rathayibacter sp. VKM Ac-2759]QHC65910.1 adenosine deaminase [Rathayibacter sp. VKM Ac-2759]
MTTTWVDPADPLAALAKVSLHDHLDGSVRPATLLELAAESGAPVPRQDPEALQHWFTHFAELEPGADWELLFGLTTSVMQTAPQLRRIAREYVGTLAADGVVYAETRWAPEKHLARGLSMDEALAAVQDGLDAGMRDAARDGRPVLVRQLLSIMRTADRGPEVVAAALRNRDAVVGIDLAGHEEGRPAREHAEWFRLAAAHGLSRTVHAGEMAGADSIEDALDSCAAQRIGHGARLAEDIAVDGRVHPVGEVAAAWRRAGGGRDSLRLGPLAQRVVDEAIPLEMCPTSNSQPGGVVDTLAQHPVGLLHAAGVAVTVHPDNRLLSRTGVTGELRVMVDRFGWGLADIERAQRTALAAGFLDDERRERLREERLAPSFARASE